MAKEKKTAFQVRVTDDFLAKLDAWRARKRPILSRSEAIRVIVNVCDKIPSSVLK